MNTDPYQALGIAAEDAAILASAAAGGVPGNLVFVRSPDAGLSFEAARLAAAANLTPEHAALDVHLAVPAGDRWTIEEIDERILRPASLKAFDRTHIVVAEADQMSQAAYDHVLKTVEEPTSGAQFWFTLTDLDTIPVTLRGRSAATFNAMPAPVEERVHLLTSAGADPDSALSVAQLAGADVRLALAVAGNADLLDDLRRYREAPLFTTTPTASADDLLAAIISLAAALPTAAPTVEPEAAPTKAPRKRAASKAATAKAGKAKAATLRPRWDTLSQGARPDARRLVRRTLDRWVTEAIGLVAAATTAQELRRYDSALQAIAQARSELATNAPAATALPALLSRVAIASGSTA